MRCMFFGRQLHCTVHLAVFVRLSMPINLILFITMLYLIDKLENVQRQFTKRVTSLSHATFQERLSVLKLEPLELRRIRFDLIQYYKIFNNLTSLNHADYFRYHQPSMFTRNSSPILIKPMNCPNHLLTFFFTDHLTAGTRSRPNYDKLSHLISSNVNY